MIRLSPRYALPLALLALGAAVPVYVHGAGLLNRDACAAPGVLGESAVRLEGAQPVAEESGAESFLQHRLGDLPWSGSRTEPLRVALIRDYDAVDLSSDAHVHVTRRFETSTKGVETWERDGRTLPVHWLVDRSRQRPQFAAYVFVQGDRPVTRPLVAILASAPARLVRGARPTTLMAVGGTVPASRLDAAREAAARWLFAAWKEYRLACGLG